MGVRSGRLAARAPTSTHLSRRPLPCRAAGEVANRIAQQAPRQAVVALPRLSLTQRRVSPRASRFIHTAVVKRRVTSVVSRTTCHKRRVASLYQDRVYSFEASGSASLVSQACCVASRRELVLARTHLIALHKDAETRHYDE